MSRANVNASEVARRVWGSTKDKRGYDVARNRDRIGHYLSGSSYPEPENLARLAEAVGVTVEELAMPRGTNPGTAHTQPVYAGGGKPLKHLYADTATGELSLISLPAEPGKVRLQVDRIVPWKLGQDIHEWLKKAEIGEPLTPEENERIGEIVGGSEAMQQR